MWGVKLETVRSPANRLTFAPPLPTGYFTISLLFIQLPVLIFGFFKKYINVKFIFDCRGSNGEMFLFLVSHHDKKEILLRSYQNCYEI